MVDFYCPTVRLAIEVDGDSHFQKGSSARDKSRQKTIESFGIHFLRFRNVEVFEHLEVVLEAIERSLLGMKSGQVPEGPDDQEGIGILEGEVPACARGDD